MLHLVGNMSKGLCLRGTTLERKKYTYLLIYNVFSDFNGVCAVCLVWSDRVISEYGFGRVWKEEIVVYNYNKTTGGSRDFFLLLRIVALRTATHRQTSLDVT